MKKNILLKSSLYKQISRFSVAGLSAVAVDFLSYYLLINYLSYDLSKTLSFIIGAIVAYVINKFWTFEKNNLSFKELAKFALLYTFSLIINVYMNKLFLDITNNIIIIAFLLATGSSALINFIGQKWWVFKK
jgi:putative flippase GtrA